LIRLRIIHHLRWRKACWRWYKKKD